MDYKYFSKHCKLIAIDLKQQINFIGRVTENEGATMFFIAEKSEEATFEFSQKLQQLFDFEYV